MNEASIDWDESATVVLPEESAEKADMLIASDAAYACKRVTFQAEKGAKKSLFQTLRTAGKLHVQTELTAEDGAEIELIQLVVPGENALVYDEVIGHCHGSGRIVLRQVTLGHGDVYAQTGIGLDGENASFAANIGYLARKNQTLDMNLVVNHWGKKTKCEINASGALNDAAKKIFRGTIDFKRGSSGSVGSEQETVLMLGEDAVNKTVPVILCAEENVEGTHGATIGEMDDDTRFYFGSRGIDRETAEKLLSRAAIARVAQQVFQQAKFRGREVEGGILHFSGMGVRAQANAVTFQRGALGFASAAPQHGPYPQHKLAYAEGFDHIIVCAQAQAHHPVHLFAAGREHEYGDVSRFRLRAQPPADFKAVQPRQHDVQQDQRGRVPPGHVQGLGAVGRFQHAEAFALQIEA